MTNPSTPGQEGPSFAPPTLPAGWIAQWDGMGKKYYFVQLSTGVSQWETPTQAAPTVGTPVASPEIGTGPFATPGKDGERGIGAQDGQTDRSLGVCHLKYCINRELTSSVFCYKSTSEPASWWQAIAQQWILIIRAHGYCRVSSWWR